MEPEVLSDRDALIKQIQGMAYLMKVTERDAAVLMIITELGELAPRGEKIRALQQVLENFI